MIDLETIPIDDVPQGGVYIGQSKTNGSWHINIIVGRHENDSRIMEHMTLTADFAEYLRLITSGMMRREGVWQFPDGVTPDVWFTGIVIPIKVLHKEDWKHLHEQVDALKAQMIGEEE